MPQEPNPFDACLGHIQPDANMAEAMKSVLHSGYNPDGWPGEAEATEVFAEYAELVSMLLPAFMGDDEVKLSMILMGLTLMDATYPAMAPTLRFTASYGFAVIAGSILPDREEPYTVPEGPRFFTISDGAIIAGQEPPAFVKELGEFTQAFLVAAKNKDLHGALLLYAVQSASVQANANALLLSLAAQAVSEA